MGRTRQKHFNTAYETQTLDTDQPPPHIFQTLISAMEGPEGLKPPLLKSLYYLLIRLSSNPPICCSNYGAVSNYLGTEISQYGFKVTFKDICNLSDILFRELGKGFKQLFSSLCDVSASRARGQASLQSDTWATAKELNLLLRCCMVILNLLVSDQNLLLEKCQVLLAILGKLCSSDLIGGNEKNAITFKKSVSRECTYSDNGCTTSFAEDFVASLSFLEQSDPCLPFLCSILEVFADELLVHRPLREYFMLIDSVSSTSEMLFTCHSRDGDIGSVLEVISAHFFLSVSDEQAFEHFLNRLYWLHGKNFTVPELSPTAAISLLLHPIMLSAPKVFQAHLISLVSEVIGIGMGPENIRPDLRLMDQYLSAFERSVILYTRHMSSLQMVGHPVGDKGSFDKACKFGRSFQPSFESYIHPVTGNKINRLITKLDNSWHSCLRNMFFRTKSDLVTASIAYIKENQYVLDKSHRDEILSILSCIILRALSGDVGDTVLQNNGDTSPQDIYLLASILKLMSSSMLQAIRCIRHSGNFGYLKTLKDFSSCKEYDFMVGIIGCFRQFSAHLPIQKFLCDMMETHTTRHEESKLMLLHFSGLLSLSFISGLDFLVKGCIFTMMTLMNLFIFEEGNLDALRSLLGSGLESFPSGLSPDKVQEAQVDKKSSLIVASKFQKIQMLYLSTDSLASDHLGTQDGKAEILANASIQNEVCEVGVEEETSNGEIFLKCIQEGSQKSSDFDDLADFIECKQGKNYSGWLKDRQRYRKWKCEKMTVLRNKRWWNLFSNPAHHLLSLALMASTTAPPASFSFLLRTQNSGRLPEECQPIRRGRTRRINHGSLRIFAAQDSGQREKAQPGVDTRIHWDNPDEGWIGGSNTQPTQQQLKAEDEKQKNLLGEEFADFLNNSTDSHYQFLGVSVEADLEEIKAAYRRLSKEYHPDTTSLPLKAASDKFLKLREVYDVLSNEQTRRFYDWTLAQEAASRQAEKMKMKLEDPYQQELENWESIPDMVDRLGGKNMDLSDQAMTALTFDVVIIIFAICCIIYVLFFKEPYY